jgi:hypothetical protein
VIKRCEKCGAEFRVKAHRADTARFCSFTCRGWSKAPGRKGARPTNAFQAGHSTWNAGMRGVHFSPGTEFKPGHRGPRVCDVGAVRLRSDHGNVRAFVKVAEPDVWKLRAVLVWEEANGPVPDSHVVHHIDRNTLNDDLGNLECCSRDEHIREHHAELAAKQISKPAQQPLFGGAA